MRAEHGLKMTCVIASVLLTLSPSSMLNAQSQPSTPGAASDNPTAGVNHSAKELQSLVAPIALYPDPLVAQILTASSYPDQVAAAGAWYRQNAPTAGSNLMVAVDAQSWDPSVKALTQFPEVLNNMASNLSWTSALGEAYHNQTSEVMGAIQNLRAQAQAAGNLKSGSQITVAQQSPGVIVIQPANPQVVYVPVYDPAVVYGSVYVVPGYAYVPPPPGAVVAAGVLGFAAGVAIASSHASGCCAWGWSSWNCGWHGSAAVVVYHGGAYPPNPAWHGGYYNGGYHQTNTNISGNTVNVNRSSQSLSQDRTNFNQSHPQAAQTASQDRTNFEQSHPQATQKASQDRSNFDAAHPSSGSSWAQRDSGAHSNALSGLGGHSDGFGNSGGWDSRASSSRGWGSMRSGGFGGGRFGGGGFGGGGFRR